MSIFYTRDYASMVKWAKANNAATLRAVRDEAERDGDRALIVVIDAELRERGF